MKNLSFSDVISALYRNQIKIEEFKSHLGRVVLENYRENKKA